MLNLTEMMRSVMKFSNSEDLEVYERVRSELLAGEELLWVGRPARRFALQVRDIFFIPFSIFWAGFAFFWEGTVIVSGAPFFFALFGVPFVIIGLYLVLGRFIYEHYQRVNTFYGLTKTRAIIRQDIFPKSTKSLSLKTLTEIGTQERRSGHGDIILQGQKSALDMFNRNYQAPKFENIPEYRSVYEKLLKLQE